MKNKTNLNMPGFKLPHMSALKVKKTDSTPSHEERQLAAAREQLEEVARKQRKKNILKPMEPVVEGLVSDAPPKQTINSSGGNDLDEFLKRVESRKIKNPEYADVEGPEYSKSYDFFITNRNEESDKVAMEMDSLNKTIMNQAKNRQFDEMQKTRAYQQNLMNQYDID